MRLKFLIINLLTILPLSGSFSAQAAVCSCDAPPSCGSRPAGCDNTIAPDGPEDYIEFNRAYALEHASEERQDLDLPIEIKFLANGYLKARFQDVADDLKTLYWEFKSLTGLFTVFQLSPEGGSQILFSAYGGEQADSLNIRYRKAEYRLIPFGQN